MFEEDEDAVELRTVGGSIATLRAVGSEESFRTIGSVSTFRTIGSEGTLFNPSPHGRSPPQALDFFDNQSPPTDDARPAAHQDGDLYFEDMFGSQRRLNESRLSTKNWPMIPGDFTSGAPSADDDLRQNPPGARPSSRRRSFVPQRLVSDDVDDWESTTSSEDTEKCLTPDKSGFRATPWHFGHKPPRPWHSPGKENDAAAEQPPPALVCTPPSAWNNWRSEQHQTPELADGVENLAFLRSAIGDDNGDDAAADPRIDDLQCALETTNDRLAGLALECAALRAKNARFEADIAKLMARAGTSDMAPHHVAPST
ncbi:hypothetical protein M885DRAFT_565804 [Pelagophyceae sp. CCMP2097]|nr:hypothetical protein M885DRAFT_565804 [Pelagophyceae sp. CCMP2097]